MTNFVGIGNRLREALNSGEYNTLTDMYIWLSQKCGSAIWRENLEDILKGFVMTNCSFNRDANVKGKFQMSMSRSEMDREIREWVCKKLNEYTDNIEWKETDTYICVNKIYDIMRMVRWVDNYDFTKKFIMYPNKPKRTKTDFQNLCDDFGLDKDVLWEEYLEVRDKTKQLRKVVSAKEVDKDSPASVRDETTKEFDEQYHYDYIMALVSSGEVQSPGFQRKIFVGIHKLQTNI